MKRKHLKAVSVALMMVVGLGIAVPMTTYAATPATWTANPAADEALGWQSVAWSPDLKIFVAVSTNKVMVSPDSIKWKEYTTPTDGPSKTWRGIAWSPTLKIFVVVGGSTGTSQMNAMTSTDGVSWTLQNSYDTRPWSGVIWANNQFVAVGLTAGAVISPDGVTWTFNPSPTLPTSSRSIAWSAQDGYVATSSTASPARMFTSTNAIAWAQQSTAQGITVGGWQGVTYSPQLDLFVAVGTNGIMTSNNGVNWTNQTTAVTSLRSVIWSPENSEFVAVGAGGIVTSPDGVIWTPVTPPAANTWASITWSPQLSRYVATSIDGTNRTMVGLVPIVPTSPLSLDATLNGKNVNLSWNTPTFDGNSAITGYRIERSMNGGAFEVIVANTGSPAIAYTDTATSPETSYSYRIYALNAQGQSTVSNTAIVQIGAVLASTGLNHYSLIAIAILLTAVGLASVMWRSMKLRSS